MKWWYESIPCDHDIWSDNCQFVPDNSRYEGCCWIWKYWYNDDSRPVSVGIQIVQEYD